MSGRSNYIEKQLRHDAVYWGNPVNNGYGAMTFDPPIQTKVRWSDKQDVFVDATGQQVRSDAVVRVGFEMDLDGYLYRGRLADLSSEEGVNPLIVPGAIAIKAKSTVNSLDLSQTVRKVWLKRS